MSISPHRIDVRTVLIILLCAFYSVFAKTLGGFAYVPEADEAGNSLPLAMINATNLLSNNLGLWNPYTNGGFPQFLNPYQFNGSVLFFVLGNWQGYALYFILGHTLFGLFIYLIARSQYWLDQKLAILIALFSILSISSWGEIDIMRSYQGYVLYLLPFSIYVICKSYDSAFGRIISGVFAGIIFGLMTPTAVYSYNVYALIFVYIGFICYFDEDGLGKPRFYNFLSSFVAFSMVSIAFSIPFLLSVLSEATMLSRTNADGSTYPYISELKNRVSVGIYGILIDYKLLPLFIVPGIALIIAVLNQQKRFIVFTVIAAFFLLIFVIQNIIFQFLGDFFSPLKSLTVRTKLPSFVALVLLNIEAVKMLTSNQLRRPIAPVVTIAVMSISGFLAFMDTTRHNILNTFAAVQGESFQNIFQHPTLINLSNDIQQNETVVNGHFPVFRLHSESFQLGRGMRLFPSIAMTTYGLEGHENIIGLGYKRADEYQLSSTPWGHQANGIRDIYLDTLDGACPGEWPTHAYSDQSARLLKHAGVATITSTVPIEIDGYALTNPDEVYYRRSHVCASSGAKLRDPEKSFTPIYVYKTTDPVSPFVFAASTVHKASDENALVTLATDTSLVPGKIAVLDRNTPLSINTLNDCNAIPLDYARKPDHIAVTLNSPAPCLVVVRHAFTTKWVLKIDGTPSETFPVNHAFTGFVMKPGQTRATLEFKF